MAAGHEEIISILLEHGAWINICDEVGDTPLHWAVRESKESLLRFLIGRGADATIQNEDGETPLQLAVCLGERSMEQYLASISTSVTDIVGMLSDLSSV